MIQDIQSVSTLKMQKPCISTPRIRDIKKYLCVFKGREEVGEIIYLTLQLLSLLCLCFQILFCICYMLEPYFFFCLPFDSLHEGAHYRVSIWDADLQKTIKVFTQLSQVTP